MKKVIVVLSALFLLLSGTTKAESAERGHMGREMMNYGFGHYSAVLSANPALNLTVEQVSRIRDLDEKYAQEIKPLQAQLYGKGKALKSEWLHATPDRRKITDLQCDVTTMRNQMQERMASHRRDALNLLTPEQRAHMQNDRPGRGYYKQAGFDR